jgi:hypothetical protein
LCFPELTTIAGNYPDNLSETTLRTQAKAQAAAEVVALFQCEGQHDAHT